MRFGVFGTGAVGDTLASKLVENGHEVRMGSRGPNNPRGAEWAKRHGERASHGTFADAAAFGEMLFNCTAGTASLEALRAAGADPLAGKILIDVANPLDFSHGMPPVLSVCNTDSLAEQIQREFPGTKVVKAFNTMNCMVMVDPAMVAGAHDLFLCGNDAGARQAVAELASREFGWKSIIDVGDVTGARGMEMLLPFWLRLYMQYGTGAFNFRIAR